MRIRYDKFWPGFDPNENFFQRYLTYRGYGPSVVINKEELVDLEITSVFETPLRSLETKVNRKLIMSNYYDSKLLEKFMSGRETRLNPALKRLWYTGENVRPPFAKNFDGYLSYDELDFDGVNCYFPLWYTHLDWFGKSEFNSRVGRDVITSQLLQNRQIKSKKNKLGIVFLSNPHPYRIKIVEMLRKFGEIDVYGAYASKPVRYKIDVSQEYKFMICFENDNYPGYVTEKLLDAYLSETVPLYWGNLGRDSIYNEKSFLNLSDYQNLEHWIESVLSLDYESIYEQPLFKKEPSLRPFDDFMKKIIGK